LIAVDEPWFPEYVPTLGNAIAYSAEHYRDRIFLASEDRHWTFGEVDQESLHLAAGLLASGIGKATRVAILMGNSPEWVLTWFAAGRIGAVTVPVSTLFQPRELAWLLKFADIDTVLMHGHFAGNDYIDRMERAIPELAIVTSPELGIESHPFLRRFFVWDSPDAKIPQWARRGPTGLYEAVIQRPVFDPAFAKSAEANVSPADWLIGICTSGTTAEPKVVIHSHASAIRTTHSHRKYRSTGESTRDLAAMPFFWLGGLNGHLIPCLYEGARLVFSPSPKVEDTLGAIVREGVTRFNTIAAQRQAVFEAARAQGIDLSQVEGSEEPRFPDGTVVPPPRRGGSILGMTETFGPHGVEAAGSVLPESKAYSMGHAIAGIERRIVDKETGEELPPGSVGELQLRGYSLMQGYYKRERAEVLTADGWFCTGDLCHIDEDGFIYFDNRLSDMIKTMGANVAPREVEVLLESLPGVGEAIVFGVPDAQRGEAVVAVVVPKGSAALDPIELRERLKAELSSYKVPREVLIAGHESVPRTDAGKPRKNVLRELLPSFRET
jgi:acyl-CoA synthetase (AMP-forming)/AMP-acid ligase II